MNCRAACTALLMFASSALMAQEYEIKFSRPHKVGDKRMAVSKAEKSMEQQLVVNGQRLPDKEKKLATKSEIEVEVTDAAVDAQGAVTQADAVVKSCHFLKNDQEEELLKAGDKVHVEKTGPGKPSVTVNGKPASADASEALTFVLSSGGDDDKVYGPKHKVKLGDSWSMDEEYGVADLNKQGIPVPKNSVKGGVKLVETKQVHGEPCLHLEGFTDVDMAGVAIPNGPPGTKAKKFEVHSKLGADLPINDKLPRLHETLETSMTSEGVGAVEKNGQTITFSFIMVGSQKHEATYTPLP